MARSTGPFTEECIEGALAPWAARPGRRARQRVELLRSAAAEILLLRGHPVLPFLLATPAIGWLLERHRSAGLGLVEGALAAGGGWLGWTLVEYLMHRFLFHLPGRNDVLKVVGFVVHGHHHVAPLSPSRLAATPLQLASVAALLWGAWSLALGPLAPAAMAGSLFGYLAYEAAHYQAPHGRPTSRWLRALRDHHLKHHYERSDRRFGISSPLWDVVFRTLA
ncbi:MAG: sterol desaturase family protein [Sandaracinaceae bacterium]